MIIPMELGEESYDILLERGSLSRAGEELNLNRRVLILSDEGVPGQYAEEIAGQAAKPVVRIVPGGEGSKSFPVLEGILRDMLRSGFTRGDCVVSVGGGVIGDLGGFAAASYMRGIDFYNIPTTVLSQVDSSIGGKTAVNLDGVKNIVGAFWQPKKVLIDPDTLDTLSARQRVNGFAEALKTGLIGDKALWELFKEGGYEEDPERVIAASLGVKKRVVEADEREQGLRKILNFGHTIGHGIESVTGLLHGECVALGMIPMCSEKVREELVPLLERMGLKTRVKADPEEVYRALLHDKKMGNDGVTVVRVEEPGSAVLRKTSPETLKELIGIIVKP